MTEPYDPRAEEHTVADTQPFAVPESRDVKVAGPAQYPDPSPQEAVVEEQSVGVPPVEHLIDPAESDRFRDRWHEIKASFVDDPWDAVQQASGLTEEAVRTLTEALDRRRSDLEQHWRADKTDTERLRLALRDYRTLLDHIFQP